MVLRMTPIFLLTILYWTIYSQMASVRSPPLHATCLYNWRFCTPAECDRPAVQVFVLQAQFMERRVAFLGREYLVPAASMTVFDTIAIVVMIPIYDGIVQPLMKQLRCELSLLQRIGWGFVLAALAMLSAALVERRRMAAIAEGGNVTVMQQVTPYLLVGASEVLSSIGQIEFFYDQVRGVETRVLSFVLCLLAPVSVVDMSWRVE